MNRVLGVMLVMSLAGFMLLVAVLGVQAGYALKWGPGGVAVSIAGGDQLNPLPVSDGAGGTIISWIDGRTGTRGRIYAQRVWANGQVAWTPNGVFAISSTRAIEKFAAIDDGQGGAFIVWEDYGRGEGWPIGDLLAQHVTANGVPLWATTGLTISASWDDEEIGGLISDGSGGAILAWNYYFDYDNKANVYVQRFNANGALQWGLSGVRLTPVTGHQSPDARIASDQQHGAYVVYRNPADQVILQRILANGTPVWAGGGISLTTEPTDGSLAIVADGSGGAIVRWGKVSQRVLSTGTVLWGASGITLTDLLGMNLGAFSPLLADGEGGMYVAWEDRRLITPTIRAQHVLSTGLLGWPMIGITITEGVYPVLAGDGHGGVLALWRTDPYVTGFHSCWAQQIDANGNTQWTTLIITASTSAYSTTTCSMANDLARGEIVAWRDWRNGVDSDIYAQHISDFSATAWVYLPLTRK